MSEQQMRIAVIIKDRAARQLACNAFNAAGASADACGDLAAIKDTDEVRAFVLGLGAAAEEVLDAVVMLRRRSATVPIYVVADAAGQRHAKRVKSFGATEVIAQDMLQRRAVFLVKQVAQTAKGPDWTMSPGWASARADQGYDLQSMDLGAWLSIPGNRDLLERQPQSPAVPAMPATDAVPTMPAPAPAPAPAMPTPETAPAIPAPVAAPQDGRSDADPPRAPSLAAFAAAREEQRVQSPPAPRAAAVSAEDAGGVRCDLADCPGLVHCREEHDAQNAAILEAHKLRERRLQAEITNDLHQAMTQQIAAAEARAQARIDAGAAALRLELAAAIHRVKRMAGALMGAMVGVMVLAGLGLAWRLGLW